MLNFSPELVQTLIVFMAALAVGGVVYVFVMPYLSGEKKTEKRVRNVASSSGQITLGSSAIEGQRRRKQIQDSLKEIEAKQKSKKIVSMRARLTQAGLNISVKSFYMASILCGLVTALGVLISGSPIYVAAIAAFAAGIGLPRWMIKFLAKRREKKFLEEFANAIDVIVRGVKSGLPLNDCLRIIAVESPEPVKGEFVELCEQQRVGVPLVQGFVRMYERVPLPEVNFLSIVISIQQQAGGNLAEALSNLSNVLRERKKLRGKVQAFSAEAKSSAAIIGALPLVVMGLVYVTTPEYIALLWTEKIGNVMLMASALLMFSGVMIMRKMINFDY